MCILRVMFLRLFLSWERRGATTYFTRTLPLSVESWERRRRTKSTSPTGQRCILIVSLRGVNFALNAWTDRLAWNSTRLVKDGSQNTFIDCFIHRKSSLWPETTEAWETNRRMDRRTDRPPNRDARTHLNRGTVQRINRQTDRQTLLQKCEDASKNDWEWCGRD